MIQWAWDMLFYSQEALLGALMEVGAAAGFCKWGFPPFVPLGPRWRRIPMSLRFLPGMATRILLSALPLPASGATVGQ